MKTTAINRWRALPRGERDLVFHYLGDLKKRLGPGGDIDESGTPQNLQTAITVLRQLAKPARRRGRARGK